MSRLWKWIGFLPRVVFLYLFMFSHFRNFIIIYHISPQEQYVFIHDAVMEDILRRDTEVPTSQLHGYVNSILTPNSAGRTQLEKQFRVSKTSGGVDRVEKSCQHLEFVSCHQLKVQPFWEHMLASTVYSHAPDTFLRQQREMNCLCLYHTRVINGNNSTLSNSNQIFWYFAICLAATASDPVQPALRGMLQCPQRHQQGEEPQFLSGSLWVSHWLHHSESEVLEFMFTCKMAAVCVQGVRGCLEWVHTERKRVGKQFPSKTWFRLLDFPSLLNRIK